jgi:HEAT repeat protein
MSRIKLSMLFLLLPVLFCLSADFTSMLATVAKYDYGDSREALTTLSDMLRQASGNAQQLADYEKAMLATVSAPDTKFAAKQYLCRELSIMGTEVSAPVLEKLLYDPQAADIARYALERIPGATVDAALLKASKKTTGLVQIGVINTIGERRIADSEKVLAKVLKDKDPQVASAAAAALGKIGNAETAELLAKAQDKVAPTVRPAVMDAYLHNADVLLKSGKAPEAEAMYQRMFAAEEPLPTRAAALTGLVRTVENPSAFIINVLRTEPPELQAVAISLIAQCRRDIDLTAVAAELPKLAPQAQVQLLTALEIKGDPVVRPTVLAAVDYDNADVSTTAISALGALGEASDVSALATIVATGSDEKKAAAKESLARLNAAGTDAAILESFESATGPTQVALVEAVGDRNMTSSTPVLFKMTENENRRVRVAAFKALGLVATPDDLPNLINALVKCDGDAERREGERAVVAISRKIGDASQQGDAVISVLPTANTVVAKSSLMLVLGRIGNSKALPILQQALKGKDAALQRAAILALSEWPTAEPTNDMLTTAKTAGDPSLRILALRGFITLLGVDSDRPKSETTTLYKTALDLAENVGEKRMALSGLAKVGSPEAFDLAAQYLDNSELKGEAELAVLGNAWRLGAQRTDARLAILKKIGEQTQDAQIKDAVKQMMQ